MRTQAEILEKLIDYYNKPTEDIFIYRTEVLYEFCTGFCKKLIGFEDVKMGGIGI